MPYTAPTLAQATTALASRLNDPNNVRWVLPELQGYIREALRTWSAWTAHWRDQGQFTTTINEAFYDLPTVLPTLRAYTVTNWDLVADLQYALMEPAAPGGTWTGTDQFTLAQLSTAIQRRRDQFLRETGLVLTRTETFPIAVGNGRINLDEAMNDIRRVAWRSDGGTLYPLLVTTEWAGTHYAPGWAQSPQPPSTYSVSVTPPLQLQLIPPATTGTLDLVSINTGTPLDPALNLPLGIPDDFCWVVKYGALADLLNGDGLALDPGRAAYCEQRWIQGLEQARQSPVVLSAALAVSAITPLVNVTCRMGSLSDADRYSPTWQLVASRPQEVLLAGGNLVALNPPPGGTGGPWVVTLDVVRNAPVPATTVDILQISQDIYDSILDLAQHTALVKEGPGQTDLATALLERAGRAAGITLRFQQASQPDRNALVGQTEQDRRSVAEQRAPVLQGVEVD